MLNLIFRRGGEFKEEQDKGSNCGKSRNELYREYVNENYS